MWEGQRYRQNQQVRSSSNEVFVDAQSAPHPLIRRENIEVIETGGLCNMAGMLGQSDLRATLITYPSEQLRPRRVAAVEVVCVVETAEVALRLPAAVRPDPDSQR